MVADDLLLGSGEQDRGLIGWGVGIIVGLMRGVGLLVGLTGAGLV